jgi:polysaccharide biosynthesis protein PslH
MRIVQVVPHSFLPASDGGRQKTLGLAQALARVGELHIINYDNDVPVRHGVKVEPRALALSGGRSAVLHDVRDVSYRSRFPRNLYLRLQTQGLPWKWRPASPRDAVVHKLIARLAPDVVVADDTYFTPFAVFARGARRIVHTHNHESKLWRELSRQRPDETGWQRLADHYERLECELVPRADQVWVVRAEDVDVYRRLGSPEVRVVPNTVGDDKFDDADTTGQPGRALFFGSLWYHPNALAAGYLVDLAQRWHAAAPGWQIRIAGRGAPPALEQRLAGTAGVVPLGFVENLKAEARAAAAILIPLTLGSGTKIKTIEAMALGKPLVTTPIGAEGLGLVDGVHALIREPGAAFDEAAAQVLRAPERYASLGRNARALALERFGQGALDRAVAAALAADVTAAPAAVAEAS